MSEERIFTAGFVAYWAGVSVLAVAAMMVAGFVLAFVSITAWETFLNALAENTP
jgi:hypothetical protein